VANNIVIGTGIVDQIEIECDGDSGEKVTVNGRNLLGQLEDQSAVDINMAPIYMENITVTAAIQKIIEGTRLPSQIVESDTPSMNSLIQTEPGESKLSAILRFLEPVNCLLWSTPEGRLVVGKPNMGQRPIGKMMINRTKRSSNVLSMRIVKSAASIPSRYVVLWTAREASVQYTVKAKNVFENVAEGPKRLLTNGHNVTKTIVSSISVGADSSGADAATRLANANKAGTLILDQYAFRQMARDNFNELIVTCVVAGHYNENGQPYANDTVYNIEYDRAGINENMYLYSVEYQGTNDRGQWTILNFCKLGTIVEGAKVNKGTTNNA
jgi:prophage tail gpP-like protein